MTYRCCSAGSLHSEYWRTVKWPYASRTGSSTSMCEPAAKGESSYPSTARSSIAMTPSATTWRSCTRTFRPVVVGIEFVGAMVRALERLGVNEGRTELLDRDLHGHRAQAAEDRRVHADDLVVQDGEAPSPREPFLEEDPGHRLGQLSAEAKVKPVS